VRAPHLPDPPVSSEYEISLEEDATPADIESVVRKLVGYNERHVPPEERKSLLLLVRDDGRRVVGGLAGFTRWSWLFVDTLWLTDEMRGRGLGSELMRRAEEEAIRRGCRHAYLDTFSFQARGFYERLGYEVFGRLDDFPEGHARYFLQKRELGCS